MAINYKQCMKCHSKNVTTILYGEPTYEAYQQAEAGKVVLAGCCVLVDGPEYYCNDCEHEWNKLEAEAAAYARIRRMKASIGSFHEGKFFVDIDFATLEMKWGHGRGQEELHYKKLRHSSVDWITNQLLGIGLLNWKRHYQSEFPIMDGLQWEVELIRDGRNISKSGDNGFPSEWDQFYEVMKRYAR